MLFFSPEAKAYKLTRQLLAKDRDSIVLNFIDKAGEKFYCLNRMQ